MTITAREIVKSIKESNIYISSSDEIDQTIKYVMTDFTARLDSTLDLLKSLPSDNTKSIYHLREIEYMTIYEREAITQELYDYITLLKLHKIL